MDYERCREVTAVHGNSPTHTAGAIRTEQPQAVPQGRIHNPANLKCVPFDTKNFRMTTAPLQSRHSREGGSPVAFVGRRIPAFAGMTLWAKRHNAKSQGCVTSILNLKRNAR